jgi:hypothetical protein
MIIDHFMQMEEDKQDTRVIVFSQYRSSAAELVKQLRRQEPIIKPTIFVGQADSKNTAGMKQKEQIEVAFTPPTTGADRHRSSTNSRKESIMSWSRRVLVKKVSTSVM